MVSGFGAKGGARLTPVFLSIGIAFACLAMAAPHIGLGKAEAFFLYRWLGLSRTVVTVAGLVIAAGALLTPAFIRFGPAAGRRGLAIARRGAVAGASAVQRIRHWVGLVRTERAPSGTARWRLEWLLCAISVILAVTTLCVAAASMFWGLDFTDEGLYVYELAHRKPAARFFISPVAGKIGELFANNILYWRFIGLGLLVAGAVLFSSAVARLSEHLKLLQQARHHRLTLTCATISGALAFYAYGAPTFSYRIASSAGVLLAFAGFIHGSLATKSWQRWLWVGLASLGALMMALARPPVVLPYGFVILLLGVLLVPTRGWKPVAGLLFQHAALVLLLAGACYALLGLQEEFAAVAGRLVAAGQSTHPPATILRQHLDDMLALPGNVIPIAAQALAIGLCLALLTTVISLIARRRASKLYLSDALVWAYAIAPLFITYDYLVQWSHYISSAAVGCGDRTMLACQGPTPAQTGRIFLNTAAAPLLLVGMLLILDRYVSRSPKPAEGPGSPKWAALVFFLMAATTVSSFYTDVGWFYHVILSLGPLAGCLYLAFAALPARSLSAGSWPATLAVIGLQLAIGVDVLHNRVLFPHRQLGTTAEQTQRLESPPSLRGLHVSQQTKDIVSALKAGLEAGGFDADRDVMIAPYHIPGLILLLDARALGTPWLADLDVDCRYLHADPTSLEKVGRVFMISNSPLSDNLTQCLQRAGLDLKQKRTLTEVRVDSLRSLDLSVIPVTGASAR